MSDDEFGDRVREQARQRLEALGGADGGGGADGESASDETAENVAQGPTETGSGRDDDAKGRAFIERMRNSGNHVMQNPFGEPVVEVVAPVSLKARVETLIAEWDLNPRGYGVIAQAPSFAEEHPDVAEDLVAWQFMLDEGEEDDLKSSGWDLPTMLDELEGEPILCTKANRVQASIPVE